MGKLQGSLCYLSGGMDAALDGGVEWRSSITPILKSKGIGVLNPCDKPTFEAEESITLRKEVNEFKASGEFDAVKQIMKPIVAFDLRMVDICSFIILNINPEIHMCGSYFEATYGVQQHKPLLIVCDKGIHCIPNWMFGIIDSETMFDSVNNACDYLDRIDNGILVPTYKKWKFFDFTKIF